MAIPEFTKIRFPLTKLPTTLVAVDPLPYADFFALFNTMKEMWRLLDEAFSQVLTDAPEDGNIYGRQDGEWVVVTGGGGSVDWGSIGGTLSDQIDLQTVLNTIPDATDIYTKTKAVIQAGTNVTVTPNDGLETITIAASGGGGGASGVVAKAKVEYSALGVATLVGAQNVSSVTRVSDGRYTVNFTSAIPAGCVLRTATGRFGNNPSYEGIIVSTSRVSGEGIRTTGADLIMHAAVISGSLFDPYVNGADGWIYFEISDPTVTI